MPEVSVCITNFDEIWEWFFVQNMPVWAAVGRRNLDNVHSACYIPIIIMCISARGYARGETEDTMAEEKKKIMIHTASGDTYSVTFPNHKKQR